MALREFRRVEFRNGKLEHKPVTGNGALQIDMVIVSGYNLNIKRRNEIMADLIPKDYTVLLNDIKQRIRSTQYQALEGS